MMNIKKSKKLTYTTSGFSKLYGGNILSFSLYGIWF